MQQIHHKKNELFEVEFYKDKECTEAFDFTNAKDLYIELVNGDITPLLELHDNIHTDDVNVCVVNITAPQILQFGKYIVGADELNSQAHGSPQSDTKYYFFNVSDYNDVFEGYSFENFINITPDLSKYIPEDNAVLFLSEQDMEKYKDCFTNNHIGLYINDGKNDETFIANNLESLIGGIVEVKKGNTTIFLPRGTQSELQKANEVGKYLWENFRIKPNLCVLHCFQYIGSSIFLYFYPYLNEEDCYINKIITTNSTGILKPEDSNDLQVIDCKEIFEEYLKESN